ncbi:MAG: MCE family protein [Bacteroidales bacterium]|nr:MCE family protein [Bacteroidales bacterium]
MINPFKNIKIKPDNYRLGLFIVSSLVLFILAIYLIGREQKLFKSTLKVTTVFRDVKGLKGGNNVRFSGINVGTVSTLTILTDTTVQVELSIEKNIVEFIKKDCRATIVPEGLLGNKIIVILPGSASEKHVRQGDVLPSIEPVEIDDILKEIKSSSGKISIIADNLVSITNKIDRGEGVFGKIFTDTTITRNLDKTSINVALISNNLNEISDKMSKGQGLVGKLLVDSAFSDDLDITAENIRRISNNFEEITHKLNEGEGVIGKLFSDTVMTRNLLTASNNINEASRNLETMTNKLNELIDIINEGNGLINKLLVDESFADSLDIILNQLSKGIIDVSEASDAVKRSGLIRMFSPKDKKK